MKKIIAIIAAVIIISVGAYFVFNSSSSKTKSTMISNMQSSATTSETQTSVSNTSDKSSVASVDIKNFAFNPPTLNIKAGTKVTWTNSDNVAHIVMSDSGNLLDSKTIYPGQSYSFTFTNPGSVSYHCAIHPTMKGTR